ncbi:hypothetical protein [Paenibacillus sp. FSL H7-0331]|uniref:hypothetical protein n=1 Tax=Paenibacillus sp. FSL H7-0331 TaxID=1920421 RepID=UPI00096D85DD|nr:hypothetical protein [Paenibacillus sp. FSL H7-0331]OMF05920.1 hypothetical protein BK127_31910 [Paenibacillus sp. FSL H7-0331]
MLKLADPLTVPTEFSLVPYKIGSMEIYQFDCLLLKGRIPQITSDGSCGLLKISSRGWNGWAEWNLPCCGNKFDLIQWASVLIKLKGLTITDAFAFVNTKQQAWGTERCELVKAALHDLVTQIHNQNTKQLSDANGIILERSRLIEQSRSYFSF